MPTMSRKALEAALGAAYDQLAEAHGQAPTREALIATLTDAVSALTAAPDPTLNPLNMTLADLCRRERLPIPSADATGDPEMLVLRGYKMPTLHTPLCVLTNTGGRRFRFRPHSDEPMERYRGTSWEIVPTHQEPAVVKKLREAFALTRASKREVGGQLSLDLLAV
jgi:hypothetical protein